MQMGWIVAVRPGSPAERAGLMSPQANASGAIIRGDLIHTVEVPESNGRATRWTTQRGLQPVADTVEERDLDPLRLPHDLEQWAARAKGERRFVISGSRKAEAKALAHFSAEIDWDDSFRDSQEVPLAISSPLSIPQLGIAYSVQTTVMAVAPDSPASRATIGEAPFALEPGDMIDKVQFHRRQREGGETPGQPIKLEPYQWAWVFERLQSLESDKVRLHVSREDQVFEVTLTAESDPTWPLVDRGLVFAMDQRIERAGGIGESLMMGLQRTGYYFGRCLAALPSFLVRLVPGARSNAVGGPIMVVLMENDAGPRYGYSFLLLLSLFSTALLFANFVPIPGSDAWSMARLIYDKTIGASADKPVGWSEAGVPSR
jgi:hypothetical protein